ncbi:hypothetical protein FSP39_023812 [Pinctada imbricata]|uniref:Reverse transcriptase domain-containing protein n=1 Tax=Pinctada imbricata TaxID=66713 RepID=A0AA89C2H1_PINIB|nr:hypothetical protein FSP39_023812 [Pinctada imbricata]
MVLNLTDADGGIGVSQTQVEEEVEEVVVTKQHHFVEGKLVYLLETMAARLRQSKNIKGIRIHNNQEKEFKISQLADDTTLFLRTKADITKALNLIEEFGTLSGLILNRSKCQGLKLGGKEIIEDDFEEIDWESKLIKALGIYFGKDCEIAINENWKEKL